MSDQIKIVECPRDAWQGLPGLIPAETKAEYLRSLIAAGLSHIDAVSFVSPSAVPQMADSERVLELLNAPAAVEIIGIVVNARGAERAIATDAVRTLGIPYSVSAQFLKRNQNQTPDEALRVLETVVSLAQSAGLNVVAYISMAFGNPYGDAWSGDIVEQACNRLTGLGVKQISLADTVGLATPSGVAEIFGAVLAAHPEIEFGAHLHAKPGDAAAKIRAAYRSGCRRFDAAIGGLGGCPFAQDALVGNIPTETLLAELKDLGAEIPEIARIDRLTQSNAKIAREFGAQPSARPSSQ